EPQRLVAAYNRADHGAGAYSGLSFPEYEYFRDHADVLDGFAAYVRVPFNMRAGSESERVPGELVTSNYFSVLKPRMVLGRGFTIGDDKALGTIPEVVLSYDLWQRRFAGDRNILGQAIHLGAQPFTIVGITAPDFRDVLMDWLDIPQLWIPVNMYPK